MPDPSPDPLEQQPPAQHPGRSDDLVPEDDLDNEVTLEADDEVLVRIRAELAAHREAERPTPGEPRQPWAAGQPPAPVDDEDVTLAGPPLLPEQERDDGVPQGAPDGHPHLEPPDGTRPGDAPSNLPPTSDPGALPPPPTAGTWQPPTRARQVDPMAPSSSGAATPSPDTAPRGAPRWLVPAVAGAVVLALLGVLALVLG